MRLVDDRLVPLAPEEPRGGEARGPGADDGDPLARRRLARGRAVVHAGLVGDEALDGVDADRLVDVGAAADDLALADAHAAADRGQRVRLADEVDRLPVEPHRREGDVPLRVDARRAALQAGGDAVGVVVREEQLERRPARRDDAVVARRHFHARRHPRRARGHEVRPPLDLDDAEEARGVGLELRRVAERRDRVELVLAHDLEDRLARRGLDLASVDLDLHVIHRGVPSLLVDGAERADRDALAALGADRRVDHVHRLRSPVIASTGQFFAQSVQPVHFSGSMQKSTSAVQLAAGQRLSLMWASYSSRKYLIVVSTGFGAVWPSPQRLASLIWPPSGLELLDVLGLPFALRDARRGSRASGACRSGRRCTSRTIRSA